MRADMTLSDIRLTRAESESILWRKIRAGLSNELQSMREQNDHPADIATTTLKRGEIALLKRILALPIEVRPGANETDPFLGAESQPAGSEAAIPLE